MCLRNQSGLQEGTVNTILIFSLLKMRLRTEISFFYFQIFVDHNNNNSTDSVHLSECSEYNQAMSTSQEGGCDSDCQTEPDFPCCYHM